MVVIQMPHQVRASGTGPCRLRQGGPGGPFPDRVCCCRFPSESFGDSVHDKETTNQGDSTLKVDACRLVSLVTVIWCRFLFLFNSACIGVMAKHERERRKEQMQSFCTT
uniref:Uncharacterized protein n=1 Tax=Setaria viridis TaxID=4556 RepID=A0A4U6WEK4_SETVI|nr:hypothetical protein SEVIR_2G430966v2 [Setaria viridis]